MALWRGESERESAGGAGESAAGQRAASGAAWSRAAGRRRERGAPGPLGAELRASSRRQHGAVIPHWPAAPAAGTAGGGEAGCALADGSSAGARAQGKEQRRPRWPAPWARGRDGAEQLGAGEPTAQTLPGDCGGHRHGGQDREPGGAAGRSSGRSALRSRMDTA